MAWSITRTQTITSTSIKLHIQEGNTLKPMLGDSIFDITLLILVGIWVLGWVVLLVILIMQKIFPGVNKPLEIFLLEFGHLLDPIQKGLLVVLVLLFAIRIIAGLLGWAPSF